MKTSESIVSISKALLAAKKDFGSLLKDNTAKVKTKSGAEFSYTYADLASVIDVIEEPLSKNGLIYLQPIDLDVVTTRLVHAESGEWMSDDGVRIISEIQNDPQKQGSAITYARRYGLMSFFGIPAEDDDGNSAKKGLTATITPSAKNALQPTNSKCPRCYTVNGIHAPNCPNKEVK